MSVLSILFSKVYCKKPSTFGIFTALAIGIHQSREQHLYQKSLQILSRSISPCLSDSFSWQQLRDIRFYDINLGDDRFSSNHCWKTIFAFWFSHPPPANLNVFWPTICLILPLSFWFNELIYFSSQFSPPTMLLQAVSSIAQLDSPLYYIQWKAQHLIPRNIDFCDCTLTTDLRCAFLAVWTSSNIMS